MNALPNPFMPEPVPFSFDEARFLSDIGVNPLPVFLSDPSPEYLTAAELVPLVEVLTTY